MAFGRLARRAVESWRSTRAGRAGEVAFEAVRHPTAPEGAARDDPVQLRQLTEEMLSEWNEALVRLHAALAHPDTPGELIPYDVKAAAETTEIPEGDLPAGTPAWMRGVNTWAVRQGPTREERRATVVVTVPQVNGPGRRLIEQEG